MRCRSKTDRRLIHFQGEVWFTATIPTIGKELCKTDGTTAGTVLAIDVYPGTGTSNPGHLATLGTRFLFTTSSAEVAVVLPAANDPTPSAPCFRAGARVPSFGCRRERRTNRERELAPRLETFV